MVATRDYHTGGLYPAGLQGLCCPASRLKKEPGVSNRDINGLMDGVSYAYDARSWRDIPLQAPQAGYGDRLHSWGGVWGDCQL